MRNAMNRNKILSLRKSLNETINQLGAVQEELACGMLDLLTAEAKVEILKKEILEKKKLLISEVHIGKRGNALSMGKYNESKGLYIVKCSDGKQVTSVSEEGLLDALMEHYGLSLDSPFVKDIFARAIERYERKHPDKSKTIYNYNLDYKNFISKDFAGRDIRRITKDWLEDYTLSLIRTKNLKVSALKNFKTLLNLIYEQAICDGFIHENVAKEIKIKSYISYCDQFLAHRKTEDVLFSESELEVIFNDMWEKIERYYCPYAYMVLLHNELGCRPDELICLKWSDFDLFEGFVCIERQQIEERTPKQSFRVVEYTKNEKGVSQGGRIVPLSTKAIEVLQKLEIKKKEFGIVSEWLFTNKDGELLKKKGYFDFNNEIHKKYGFKVHGSYAFRRGLSAKLESKGIPPSERAAILGHSVETNLKHYTFAQADYFSRVRSAMG